MLTKPFYGRAFFAPDGGSGGGSGGAGAGAGAAGGEGGGSGGAGSGGGAGGEGAGGEGKGGEGEAFRAITSQEAFEAALKDRLSREATKVAEATRAAVTAELEATANEAAAKKAGDFEKLYNTALEKIAELEGKMKASDHATLVAKVAGKYKLPEPVAKTLQGETEADLEAHAKELVKYIKAEASEGGDNEAGRRGGGGTNGHKPAAVTHVFGAGTKKSKWPGAAAPASGSGS